MGLTGAESAKGFPETGVRGSDLTSWAIERYGGGAVAVEAGRGMGSGTEAAAAAPAARGAPPSACIEVVGIWACDIASR